MVFYSLEIKKGEKSICIVRTYLSSRGAEPQALPAIVCECVIVRDRPPAAHFNHPYNRTPIRRLSGELQIELSTEIQLSSFHHIHPLHWESDFADG